MIKVYYHDDESKDKLEQCKADDDVKCMHLQEKMHTREHKVTMQQFSKSQLSFHWYYSYSTSHGIFKMGFRFSFVLFSLLH